MLRRAGHLRRRDIAQLEKGRQKAAVAGGEADAQAGQVRALGQRVEHHGVGEVGPGGFQHAGGLMLAVDLAIAFVGEHQKAEAAGKRDELVEIGAASDGALRVRRRGDVEGDGARQQCVVERVEIGQEGARPRRRQIDRLAVGGERAGGIGGIERIGDQHRRLAGARFDPALGGDGGEEQALARAVEHQHFAFGIDRPRQFVAAAEPGRDRAAERFAAFVGRVAAEFVEMGGNLGADEGRNWMLRLADRQIDGGLARLDAGDQFGQPHERRAAVDRRSSG